MKANACPFQLLRKKQKCEAIKQMRGKLDGYIPANVPADDISKAMIRLNVVINVADPTYAFDSQDITRVYQAILGTTP